MHIIKIWPAILGSYCEKTVKLYEEFETGGKNINIRQYLLFLNTKVYTMLSTADSNIIHSAV